MGTELEITLPEQIPAMTLPNVAFFPQALLPLHIFERRYRMMLTEVLATNRLMAVAGVNRRAKSGQASPCRVASVGIVRACQGSEDGTSQLLIQGLCRVEVIGVATEKPYPRLWIRPLSSQPGAAPEENERSRNELARLLGVKLKLSPRGAGGLASFLKTVEDPETFVDIAAASLCDSPSLRQKLLETLDVHARLRLFTREVRGDIDTLRLERKLQGGIPDEKLGEN